jgi:hypothetical protein
MMPMRIRTGREKAPKENPRVARKGVHEDRKRRFQEEMEIGAAIVLRVIIIVIGDGHVDAPLVAWQHVPLESTYSRCPISARVSRNRPRPALTGCPFGFIVLWTLVYYCYRLVLAGGAPAGPPKRAMHRKAKSQPRSPNKEISASTAEAVYRVNRLCIHRWCQTGLLRNLAGPGERPRYAEDDIRSIADLREQGLLRAGVSLARLRDEGLFPGKRKNGRGHA